MKGQPCKMRSNDSTPPPDLPDAELEVLASIWKHNQATARQIRESMHSFRPMAHGSVVTLLKRLEAKALVCREKGPVGKAFIYRATRRPEPMFRRIMKQLYTRVYRGDYLAMVSSIFESTPPSKEEIEEIQKLLDKQKR